MWCDRVALSLRNRMYCGCLTKSGLKIRVSLSNIAQNRISQSWTNVQIMHDGSWIETPQLEQSWPRQCSAVSLPWLSPEDEGEGSNATRAESDGHTVLVRRGICFCWVARHVIGRLEKGSTCPSMLLYWDKDSSPVKWPCRAATTVWLSSASKGVKYFPVFEILGKRPNVCLISDVWLAFCSHTVVQTVL